MSLRLSSPQKEGEMRVSKWLKHQVLLDADEMRALFSALAHFSIFVVSEPGKLETLSLSHDEFLQKYEEYLEALKTGGDLTRFRRYFSSIFTVTPEVLYAMECGKERVLIKPIKPVVQLQAHQFFVSEIDGKFHSMVLGQESVSWGVQFSYPQIYQHPESHEFSKVTDTPEFPNTALYLQLARWLRQNTLPTPFLHRGVRTNVPIRLGKRCFSWINQHPQLPSKRLEVVVS